MRIVYLLLCIRFDELNVNNEIHQTVNTYTFSLYLKVNLIALSLIINLFVKLYRR